MKNETVIAGVGMIPFRKPGTSASYDLMGAQATRFALKDAGIPYGLIEQAYAGFVAGDSCSGQAALYHVGITGIPIFNVNNNCSSGSSAFALACQAVESNAVDCALAVGFEEMLPGALDSAFPGKVSPLARHQKALADIRGLTEAQRAAESQLPPALCMFNAQVEEMLKRGVSEETMAAISVKARKHAAENPNAIFRTPLSIAQVLADPPVFGYLRKLYACPPSCGASAVIVCSKAFAKTHGIRSDVVLAGKSCKTDIDAYFNGSVLDVMFQGLTRDAAKAAFEDAGVGPDDIDVIELHDCFTTNELATYVGLGLCAEADLNRYVADGENTYGGSTVINPSGGLLAKGHPLGATGLAQITELTWQLRGQAGSRQVEGARLALQHNGGLGGAGFINILKRV